MSPSHEVQIRTRMFARVIGPLFAFSCITAVVRASDMKALVTDFGANPLWSWVTGAFVLTGGLIIVAVHQYWHGSPSIIVSLVGWLLALRGLLLLAFPSTFMSMTNSLLAAGARWRTVCICFAVLGLYLTFVGWRPTRSADAPGRKLNPGSAACRVISYRIFGQRAPVHRSPDRGAGQPAHRVRVLTRSGSRRCVGRASAGRSGGGEQDRG